jgi:DNA repair protein RadC
MQIWQGDDTPWIFSRYAANSSMALIILPLQKARIIFSLSKLCVMQNQLSIEFQDKGQTFQVQEPPQIIVNYKNPTLPANRFKISNSRDCAFIFRIMMQEEIEYRENFYCLFLNRNNKVLGYSHISAGGVAGTVVDTKMIFQIALASHASSVVLAHNHPSGNLTPSEADIRLTRQLVSAGKLLDIPVIDHVILTVDAFFSFADEGMI